MREDAFKTEAIAAAIASVLILSNADWPAFIDLGLVKGQRHIFGAEVLSANLRESRECFVPMGVHAWIKRSGNRRVIS
jgi:hypothetical protein